VDLANDSTLNVKTSGRYFTVASDTNQCINYSDTLTVTVKSNPQKPTIVFDKNYLLTDTQESVQWYFNNDTIPGAVTDTLAVNDPGNYYLTVTSDSGCIAISDTRKVTILAFENPRLSDPVIYPNPAGNYIRIRSAIRGPVQLRIVSPGGDVYRNSNVLLNGNDVLDLSGMTPGLYILNIIKDEKIYSAKFIRK
jgi:hypothetical protein